RVGLQLERSPEMVVGILGVLAAGAAYVPLDPAYPEERLSFILADSGARLVVRQEEIAAAAAIRPRSPEVEPGPDDLAYLIYTSGSTGRPKGVGVTHRNVLSLLGATASGFGLGANAGHDVWTLFHSYAFDFSVWELWGALAFGGRLVVVPWPVSRTPESFRELLLREGVTVLNQTPSAFGQLTESEGFSSLRLVIFGGEALEPRLLLPWMDRYGDERPRLVNMYGITETTVHVTERRIVRGDLEALGAGSRIGRPLAGWAVYLLGGSGEPVPLGSAGEMFVGGAGVAQGYPGRPELTAERFVPDPFAGSPGARLYRSGDLARHLPDGDLEYLGRIDHQVKVRGFRIERGEIEQALAGMPGVADAAVVLRRDLAGGDGLVAYVVAAPGADLAGLRESLKSRLPDYMVPAQVVVLDALPLTANGKLDRRWLAERAPVSSGNVSETARRALQTPAEELLAGIFSDVLKVENVGADSDFFALGGHSLLATQLLSRLREAFRIELPMRAIFEQPTVAGLAREIERASSGGGSAAPPIHPTDRTDRTDLPLSFAQQRLWFLDQLEGGSLYNVQAALTVSGDLSVGVLSRVLGEVVCRHEVLRTVFRRDGDQVRQVILPPVGVVIPVVDLTALPPARREPVVAERIAAEARRPFDLARGPLLRAGLWRLGATKHVLFLALHHIVSDGWSLGVLVREVKALYTAPLPELPVQYADFAAWQRSWLTGDVLDGELRYWRDHLAGAPPVLELPSDRPRPAVQSFRGAARPLVLPPKLSAALTALSRREGATLFMTLVSALSVLLSRWAGQADFTLGTPVAGRRHLEIESLIGFFVNTLVLRPDLSAESSGSPRFTELLSRVRREALAAYAHQDLPFEKLVEDLAPERGLGATPLFQVMFAWQNAPIEMVETMDLPGVHLVPRELPEEVAKFDLTLSLQESGGAIGGSLSYSTDLFDAPTIDRLAAALSVLLAVVVEDPSLPISDLSLLRPSEWHQLMVEWNDTSTLWPSGSTLPELFARQAAAHPEQLAWEYGGETLSYEELADRSDAVARFLCRQGVRGGDEVGLCFERSGAVLIAMLGILKAGAAYLPLDPDYPRERLAWMLEDSGAPLLLTQESLAPRLPPSRARVVRLDAQWEEISSAAGEPRGASPADVAYVIYTSGSTGRPKGVAVPHRAVVRLILETDYVALEDAGRMAQLSNLSFDAATFEIWGALLSGATLVGVPQETLLVPGDLADFLAAARIHVLFFTTALFNQVAEQAPGAFASLDTVLFGGEAVDPGAVRKVLASGGPDRLLHVYGPTENTTFSTWYPIETVAAQAVTVPIGRPIANSRAYVLDAGLQPVPLGGLGELYVGGEGLALGYWRQPERTAERFVESPALPGERLYRTGDLARLLPDGNIEFRGRRDQQIKLRGFRIELGEIELALTALAEVAEAAVVLRDDLPGGRGLAAYVVGRGGAELSIEELRQALAGRLPAYMVPAGFVQLAALPLTPNGKVDRRWLAESGPRGTEAGGATRSAPGTAPRTAAEEILAGIFSSVLGLDDLNGVSAEADFFALGGHSLLATQLVSRLRAAFGVELPLRAVFEHPTVAGLAAYLEGAEAPPAPPIRRIDRGDRGVDLPLSFAQERLWFIDQLEGGSVYNVPIALRVEGELSVAVLARTLQEVVRRHEALRTVFSAVDGRVRQVVLPPAGMAVPLVDLTGLSPALRKPVAVELVTAEARRPFDLARGPLLRAGLWRLDETEHMLLLAMHHIVSDGWSLGVLVREVTALYTAFAAEQPSPLPELPVQYADFAAWQRSWLTGGVLDGELRYWRDRLAGAPPVLELPADRPRPAVQSFRGAVRSLSLPPDLSKALTALSRREGATLFMTLVSALSVLLSRLTGQEDLTLGMTVAGRRQLEIENLIGFFVNTLVLRPNLSEKSPAAPRFTELLARVRREALDAYAHQDLPFEKLVEALAPERSLSHSPLFQVMFAWQNAALDMTEEITLPGLRLVPLELEENVAKFDLSLSLQEAGGAIGGVVSYSTDLFDGTTIARWIGQLETVLRGWVDDVDVAVTELPMLSAAERHQVVLEWNSGPEGAPASGSLVSRFADVAAERPDAVAVVGDGGDGAHLTYGELAARSRRLARWLRRSGVVPGERVGLRMERSPEMMVGILGVLAAGAAYVPLDPAYPEERLSFILADSEARIVVRQEEISAAAAVREDEAGEEGPSPGPDDLAYLIYTSGSTGHPKGVGVTHGNVLSLLASTASGFGLGPHDVWTLFHSYAFDFSVWELWGALAFGGRLVVVPWSVSRTPEAFRELLGREGVTVLNQTPSAFGQIMGTEDLSSLRLVIFGGEALEPRLLQPWFDRYGDERPRLVNMYGITETTVHVTERRIILSDLRSDLGAGSRIGRPMAGWAVYLLDRSFAPVPVGAVGEIFVGGAGVSRGYPGRPELTAERFVPDPFAGSPGARLYRSGDLARHLPDGDLEYLGRIDHQVKVRGFRIELGEIEAALASMAGVAEAAVVLRRDLAGGDGLVGYVVAEAGEDLSGSALREHLKARLPGYMVPAQVVLLEALPLTANGKLDRRWLAEQAPGGETISGTARRSPRTAAEEILAGIFSQVLAVEPLGAEDDFFALGGHSLLATQLLSRLREAFAVELPMRVIFEHPTVAGLAREIEKAASPDRIGRVDRITRTDRAADLPLSFAQERLWFIDQLEGGSLYNVPVALRMSGPLSVAALARTLAEVVRRHEVLRTVFAGEGGQARQVILPPAGVPMPLVDLTALPRELREGTAENELLREARRPFDLARGPLFRPLIWRLDAAEHLVLVAMHHVVSDLWSLGVLVREVAVLYPAFAVGGPSPLPELAVQYADFAAWQRAWLSGEVLATELEHWRQRLAGAPPVLDLPLDRPRTAVRGHRGAVIGLALPAPLAADLLALSRRQGVTLFMTLLAAWQTLLSRISGQSDISVGTPIAGRNRAETEALIGFFVNTLVMRSNLANVGEGASFAGLLAQVRREALLAYAHQDLPFEKLVEELAPERNLAQTPLFQTSFALQNVTVGELELPGLHLAPYPIAESVAKFDLDLTFRESPRGLAGQLGYATELLDRTTVDRLAAKLLRLLAGFVQSPELPLAELALLSAAEQHQLLREWNDSSDATPASDLCLHELFERQAARTPDAVAVSGDRGHVSYGELDCRANRLARFLRDVRGGGVGPEVTVGLLVERTPALVTAILGVLKAGGVHVPFDPTYPRERLALLAEDANVLVILTEDALAARLPAELWESCRVVRLDADWPQIARRLPTPLEPAAASGNAAYITYTSGSTGKPKGVVITHGTAVDFTLGPAASLGLDATDRVLQFSALSFDLTIEEIFPVLAVGGQVVLRDPAELATTHGLMRALTEEAVTTVELPTAYWHDWVFELQRSGERLPASLRRLLTGTERVLPERVDAWRTMGVPLFHLFGVTEATINSTLHVVEPAVHATPTGAQLPIGRPSAGRRVYVTDGELREMPLGVTGELALGGGLARGYLGRPDLTASKFVPDPFGGGWGERLYLTGDLARWLADGNLIFLGRRDWQVKVRGFRIELGEVEAALAALPEVREAVVMARQFASHASGAGDQRLVAYVVTEEGEATSPAGLRARLATTLPPHMVPSYFVSLPALPLLANGKVDRRALPAPEEMDAGIGDERGAAPRTPAEEVLAGLWSDLLGAGLVGSVGREDDFFARGGHSLLATQLVSRVRTAFGIELPLRAVFEHPTVAGLAQEIEQRSRLAGTAPPPLVRIDRVDRANDLPLSFAQQRLWFLDQLEGGSLYNVPIALRIEGDLSVALLSQALAEVVRRHEVLRTVFSQAGSEADGEPRQVILPAAGFEMAHVDLTSLPPDLREPVAAERIAEEARRPFDLARGPLFRAGLWRLGTTDHLLLLAMHHIVSDGWSLGVLVHEVTALYAALLLPELPVQYADFAAWQRSWLSGDVLDGELSWWREHLAGAPPLLELPTDRPRAAAQSRIGGTLALAFDPELSAALSRLAQHRSATLFMVLLAAFQSLLGRLAGAPDLCVGTPIAGRTRRETEDLIGFFVNTLVMRGDLSGDPAFAEHLARVRREALAVYAHQDLPFEKLVGELALERNLSTTPIFQVFLALQNAPLGPVELPGVKLVPVELESGLARFDLEISLEETAAGLTGAVQYDAGLFDRTTAARLASQLDVLLRSAVASPERRLSDLPLLTAAERQQLIEEWSHAETVPRLSGTLHGLFAAQAARTPAATAVIAGTERLSYGELDARANRLARRLRSLGVGPEVPVAVCAGRSAGLVAVLLAVLKAGGAYLPLDPNYPPERLAFLLADTGAAVLLTESALARRCGGFSGVVVEMDRTDPTDRTDRSDAPLLPPLPGSLAYLIYTSGSTGVPKGVAIPHGSALRLVEWALARYSAAELAGVLFSTSTSFDLSIFELFVPLSSGGAVIVADNALALPGLPAASEVTLVNTVPSALAGLLDLGPLPAAVRTVNLAGEPLRGALAERLHGSSVARLWNLYGPSEDTTYSTGTEVAPEVTGTGREPDIGRPLAGSTAFVLDGSLEVLPVGVPGELCLGGEALARGYLNRPALTAERFVPNPFGGSRLYRTGDRARWRSDGALELLGRMDHQVKVRGFRIELGEIEAVLAGHPAVREAAVTAAADTSGDRRLVAYVSATEGGGPLDAAALGVYLGSRLPAFMVPSMWVELAALPRTRTGKVDRQALPAPGETARGQTYEAPRTATEEVLAEIWGDLLRRQQVGVHDNFFTLGGHSLLATQVVCRLRDRLGVELPVRALFEQPTVAGLAVLLADHYEGGAQAPPILPIIALPRDAEGGGMFPASFAQRRLWLFDQLEAESVYNMPLALSLEGELDEKLLAAVFGELARRHETLRTTFTAGTDGPLQVVHPAAAWRFALQTIDLSALGDEERRRELTRRVAEESLRPFDLASGPLLRGTLVRLAARDNALLLTLH
ncbi:MAG TPA: amino acid adenylation domain-containing protein, partial [Thermoanaerobaculia bacterium]|nr:amino acid adenylation domain-containing protein [Thermoanaerobaculia bacterium]